MMTQRLPLFQPSAPALNFLGSFLAEVQGCASVFGKQVASKMIMLPDPNGGDGDVDDPV